MPPLGKARALRVLLVRLFHQPFNNRLVLVTIDFSGRKFGMKKVQTEAEKQWRKEQSDLRWEKREEYLMRFFSAVSISLPRQITHQKAAAALKGIGYE